jgi:hypothetical protein
MLRTAGIRPTDPSRECYDWLSPPLQKGSDSLDLFSGWRGDRNAGRDMFPDLI